MADRKLRVSGRVRVAIEKMVDHGLTRAEAAKLAGLTDHALYCALRKPHVLRYKHERMEVLRKSEAARTIKRAADLADNAVSEHVRTENNIWLAGLEGIAPVARSESTHLHVHTAPGLTIVFSETPPAPLSAPLVSHHALPVIDNSDLPTPVPHPSQVKRLQGGDE